MKKTVMRLTIAFLVLFLISFIIYLYGKKDIWETLSITFGVSLYHFGMRLSVGCALDRVLHNRVDYTKRWFRERPFEGSLYKALRVKKWKGHMPTYQADYFDLKKHSIAEIIGAGCQAELVHEIIVAFSFLPILLAICFKPAAVFVITSILAALFDSMFVIMQRYNRPRLLRLIR